MERICRRLRGHALILMFVPRDCHGFLSFFHRYSLFPFPQVWVRSGPIFSLRLSLLFLSSFHLFSFFPLCSVVVLSFCFPCVPILAMGVAHPFFDLKNSQGRIVILKKALDIYSKASFPLFRF